MFYDEHFIIFRILIIFRIISNDSSSSQCLTLQSSERKNIISYTFNLTKLSLCISVKYVKQHNIFHKFKKKKKNSFNKTSWTWFHVNFKIMSACGPSTCIVFKAQNKTIYIKTAIFTFLWIEPWQQNLDMKRHPPCLDDNFFLVGYNACQRSLLKPRTKHLFSFF